MRSRTDVAGHEGRGSVPSGRSHIGWVASSMLLLPCMAGAAEAIHMSNRHTHFVTTTDGVEIGGVVHGQGPPLVFLPGGVGDSDLDWRALLPYLTGRFTCYLPRLRGRGLSGDHPDLR